VFLQQQMFAVGMKARWYDDWRRILLGDDAGGEAITLQPVRFQYFGVWISTGLQLLYIVHQLYAQFRLTTSPAKAGECRCKLFKMHIPMRTAAGQPIAAQNKTDICKCTSAIMLICETESMECRGLCTLCLDYNIIFEFQILRSELG